MEIFKLFGSVLVETSGAEKGLNNVDKQAKGVTDKIGGYISTATKWMAGIGAVVSAAGAALIAQVNETASYGDEIDKQSQRLGFTAQEYQEWEHVLEHYGTSLSEVGKQIVDLYQNVASGKESTIDALATLGITLNEAAALTPAELFKRVVTALQGVKDEGARAALASELFKGAAEKLNPVMNATSEEVDAARKHLSQMNALMSDDAVKMSAAYSDSVTDVNAAWRGLKNAIGEWAMPAMIEINKWIAEQGIPKITEWTTALFGAMDNFWNWVNGTQTYALGEAPGAVEFAPGGALSSSAVWNAAQAGTGNAAYADPRMLATPSRNAGNTGGTVINQYISSVPQTPADFAAATRASFEQARWLP